MGFSAIALGAYGDHGLRGAIDEHAMRSFETAIRYHLFHALALLGIGLGLSAALPPAILKKLFWVSIVMLAGTVIFSGSIYTSVIFNMPLATKAAPFGGTTLMIGWLMLIWIGISKPNAIN